mgnify:FL=1
MNGVLYAYSVIIKRDGFIFPELLNGIIGVDPMYSNTNDVANLIYEINANIIINEEFTMEFKNLQMIGIV